MHEKVNIQFATGNLYCERTPFFSIDLVKRIIRETRFKSVQLQPTRLLWALSTPGLLSITGSWNQSWKEGVWPWSYRRLPEHRRDIGKFATIFLPHRYNSLRIIRHYNHLHLPVTVYPHPRDRQWMNKYKDTQWVLQLEPQLLELWGISPNLKARELYEALRDQYRLRGYRAAVEYPKFDGLPDYRVALQVFGEAELIDEVRIRTGIDYLTPIGDTRALHDGDRSNPAVQFVIDARQAMNSDGRFVSIVPLIEVEALLQRKMTEDEIVAWYDEHSQQLEALWITRT